MFSEDPAQSLPPLDKPLLKMKSSLILSRLAKFVYKKLATKDKDLLPEDFELLLGNRAVSSKRNLGSCMPKAEENVSSVGRYLKIIALIACLQTMSTPLLLTYRRKV